MKTVLQILVLSLAMFLVGAVVGVNVNVGGKYQAGQLDACNKIVKMDPILALAEVTCISHFGEVALQVGDKLYSLDGKQLNP